MSPTKPAIVIVPGAWHIPKHYKRLQDDLISAGYEVTTCDMPSTGPPEPMLDMDKDIAVVRKAVQSYIDRDLNVVLVMHSIGGTVAGNSCEGLRPQDQANGKGLVSLVYLAAFALPKGKSMLGLKPDGKHAPWVGLTGEPGTGIFMRPENPPSHPNEIFYNDCTPEQQQEAYKDIVMEYSEIVNHIPASGEPWKEIETNYLICEIDNAIPVMAQELMSSWEGGKWKRVERLHCGHSPFLSRPEETLSFVRRSAGEKLGEKV